MPFEQTEAILEGMVAAFEFFGGVPREVWWDNPRTVATLIKKGRERQVHPRYAASASHHVFEPKFRMPARGNEKPDAEGTVKAVQKRFATPVPRVADLDQLNASLRPWCEAERGRVVRSLAGPFPIGDRLAEDLASASHLPRDRFEACVIHPAVAVDMYQTVVFDGNRYSVPRPFAFGLVTVKGFVDRVAIVSGGQVVATHARSLEKSRMILDPLHFLAALDRKPGSLDHTPVFRDWGLPACFADFRGRLERQHGPSAGARQYARGRHEQRRAIASREGGAIRDGACRDASGLSHQPFDGSRTWSPPFRAVHATDSAFAVRSPPDRMAWRIASETGRQVAGGVIDEPRTPNVRFRPPTIRPTSSSVAGPDGREL